VNRFLSAAQDGQEQRGREGSAGSAPGIGPRNRVSLSDAVPDGMDRVPPRSLVHPPARLRARSPLSPVPAGASAMLVTTSTSGMAAAACLPAAPSLDVARPCRWCPRARSTRPSKPPHAGRAATQLAPAPAPPGPASGALGTPASSAAAPAAPSRPGPRPTTRAPPAHVPPQTARSGRVRTPAAHRHHSRCFRASPEYTDNWTGETCWSARMAQALRRPRPAGSGEDGH
jgi:hypothetical protein